MPLYDLTSAIRAACRMAESHPDGKSAIEVLRPLASLVGFQWSNHTRFEVTEGEIDINTCVVVAYSDDIVALEMRVDSEDSDRWLTTHSDDNCVTIWSGDYEEAIVEFVDYEHFGVFSTETSAEGDVLRVTLVRRYSED